MKMEGSNIHEATGVVVGEETHLTVLKTSNFFAGDGFCAYDSKGKLVFRTDWYDPGVKGAGEVVLMDADGRCLLTVRRKRRSMHQRWEGFTGERVEGQSPVFGARKSSMLRHSSITVEMYNNPGEEYQIVGSFAGRSCTVLNGEKKAVAEIRRKVVDASSSVVLGKEVFWLSLKAGVDVAFVMALVLVLNQIQGDEQALRTVAVDTVKQRLRTYSAPPPF